MVRQTVSDILLAGLRADGCVDYDGMQVKNYTVLVDPAACYRLVMVGANGALLYGRTATQRHRAPAYERRRVLALGRAALGVAP